MQKHSAIRKGYSGYIIGNTLIFTLVTTALKTILGVGLALMFNGKWVKKETMYTE